MVERAQEDIRDECYNADEENDQRHQPRIFVLNVREFMREHAFDLRLLQFIEEARGHGDGGMLFERARGERIRGAILDEVQGRHRHAAADREVLERVVELRCIALRHLLRVRHHEHGVLTECERNEDIETSEEECGQREEVGIARLHLAEDHRNRGEENDESYNEEDRGEPVEGEVGVDNWPGGRE